MAESTEPSSLAVRLASRRAVQVLHNAYASPVPSNKAARNMKNAGQAGDTQNARTAQHGGREETTKRNEEEGHGVYRQNEHRGLLLKGTSRTPFSRGTSNGPLALPSCPTAAPLSPPPMRPSAAPPAPPLRRRIQCTSSAASTSAHQQSASRARRRVQRAREPPRAAAQDDVAVAQLSARPIDRAPVLTHVWQAFRSRQQKFL
ncbi:uncharacterized protein C8Q71DRAFT_726696 [Rhodofomes roseus]|uniref:Uncharacterized protein n=1 Tax=Rhodofomes roseus TaxID=34475 RepID=A0ABQ8K4M1_9APHY|nr:uncharacterized protein C8Q71DRAFT_726696 [Rhodofomes roseus]KAH9831849.1 hypothetical protein C8Q71DRAFT_726696 [Rhodofomes roseus]